MAGVTIGRLSRMTGVSAETIRYFLPVVDDLERALGQIPADAAGQRWVEGLSLIGRNLAAAFERLGLERMGAEGEPFDPTQHEAVSTEPALSPEDDHVVSRVFQQGYLFNGQLLRPARVVVKQWNG